MIILFYMNTFNKVLKQLRHNKKLTQQQLAEQTGLSRNQINSYENGITEPDLASLHVLATYYQISLDYLLGVDTPKSDYPELDNIYTALRSIYSSLDKEQQKMYLQELTSFLDYLSYKMSKKT